MNHVERGHYLAFFTLPASQHTPYPCRVRLHLQPIDANATIMPGTAKRNSYVPVDEKTAGRSTGTPRQADRFDQRLDTVKYGSPRPQTLEEKLRLEALGQHAPGKSKVVTLPQWPPNLNEDRIAYLTRKATTWALAHSFVLVPPHPVDEDIDPRDRPSNLPPIRAQPAPLSLFPTPFPRRLYQQANSLQNMLNALYLRVTLDWTFMDRIMEKVAPVDAFQARLYYYAKKLRGKANTVLLLLISLKPLLTSRVDNSVYSDQIICSTNRK